MRKLITEGKIYLQQRPHLNGKKYICYVPESHNV
jgi:hypothetical protein